MGKGNPIVQARVSKEQHAQLVSLSKARVLTVSDLIREAIEAYLSTHPVENASEEA